MASMHNCSGPLPYESQCKQEKIPEVGTHIPRAMKNPQMYLAIYTNFPAEKNCTLPSVTATSSGSRISDRTDCDYARCQDGRCGCGNQYEQGVPGNFV